MAEWISVYCRRQIGLDAEALRRALDAADLWTLAEVLDLPEDELDSAVKSTLRNLRVEPTHVGTAGVEVHWKAEGRPIHISSVTGAKASELIAETLEERLPPATVPGLVRVQEHLSRCRQVVNFEMGSEDAQHLGAVLGEVLAFTVAEPGEGLVCYFDQAWASPEDRAATIWTTGDRATPEAGRD